MMKCLNPSRNPEIRTQRDGDDGSNEGHAKLSMGSNGEVAATRGAVKRARTPSSTR